MIIIGEIVMEFTPGVPAAATVSWSRSILTPFSAYLDFLKDKLMVDMDSWIPCIINILCINPDIIDFTSSIIIL